MIKVEFFSGRESFVEREVNSFLSKRDINESDLIKIQFEESNEVTGLIRVMVVYKINHLRDS